MLCKISREPLKVVCSAQAQDLPEGGHELSPTIPPAAD